MQMALVWQDKVAGQAQADCSCGQVSCAVALALRVHTAPRRRRGHTCRCRCSRDMDSLALVAWGRGWVADPGRRLSLAPFLAELLSLCLAEVDLAEAEACSLRQACLQAQAASTACL